MEDGPRPQAPTRLHRSVLRRSARRRSADASRAAKPAASRSPGCRPPCVPATAKSRTADRSWTATNGSPSTRDRSASTARRLRAELIAPGPPAPQRAHRHRPRAVRGDARRRHHPHRSDRPRRRRPGCSSTSSTRSPTAGRPGPEHRVPAVPVRRGQPPTATSPTPAPSPTSTTTRSTPDELDRFDRDIDTAWVERLGRRRARGWAIANLASPHFDEIAAVTTRPDRQASGAAVEQRLDSEIQLLGRPSRRAQATRAPRQEAPPQLRPSPPTRRRPRRPQDTPLPRARRRSRPRQPAADRRRRRPRHPPGPPRPPRRHPRRSEIEPGDRRGDRPPSRRRRHRRSNEPSAGSPTSRPTTTPASTSSPRTPRPASILQIEVKGHRARPPPRSRSGPARSARPSRTPNGSASPWRPCPDGLRRGAQRVRYFIRPFDAYELHFAQTYVPLNVADLMPYAVEPQ